MALVACAWLQVSPVSWARSRPCLRLLATLALAVVGSVSAQEPVPVVVSGDTFRGAAEPVGEEGTAEERPPVAPSVTYELAPPTDAERAADDPSNAGRSGAAGPAIRPLPRVGIGRSLSQLRSGAPSTRYLKWSRVSDGGLALAVAVASRGAAALRVRLVIRGAPDGMAVRVYDPRSAATSVEGVPRVQWYDEGDGSVSVWTPTVSGERTVVELYLPAGVEPGSLEVSIPTLSHFDALPTTLAGIGASTCPNTDIACASDWVSDATRRAVAKYIFTTRSGETSRCTGTLLNDADARTQIPYFLTARHCPDNARDSASMELYWFFERRACGGPDPMPGDVRRQTGGATELVSDSVNYLGTGTDHLLLRLNTAPPDGVGLAGWRSSMVATGERTVGVYHPAGDLKKVNESSVREFAKWTSGGAVRPHRDGSHILVTPRLRTEGGSSGSGLWTRVDGGDYLVGVLTGGDWFCRPRDYYGRFDRFYPKASRWLGPADATSEMFPGHITRLALADAGTGEELADLTAGGGAVQVDGGRSINIVAETVGRVGSVAWRLSGPVQVARSGDLPPHTLFGHGGGNGLPAGAYTVAATGYKGARQGAPVRNEVTASFSVTAAGQGRMAVTGVSLAAGAGPRVQPLADRVRVSVYEGEPVELRARTAGGAVARVAFVLDGASSATATADAVPFVAPVSLVAGTYRLTATPHAAAGAQRAAGEAMSFSNIQVTVLPPPVTGFTLVDAAGGPPDPDLGPVVDRGTVDLSSTGGWASIRADLARGADVARVELELAGARRVARSQDAPGPMTLFGVAGGDYAAGVLPNGEYTLTARPFASDDPRDALPESTVAFTVEGSHASAVTGFTLVDAQGGAPDRDVGPVDEGATLSLARITGGWASIRADVAPGTGVGWVRLELRGRVSATRRDDLAPYSLFGDDGRGDYRSGALPDGDYRLTARPFSARGSPMTPLTRTFSVVDSVHAATEVSGFTLVDATGGPPDPDVAPVTDGSVYYVDERAARTYNIRVDVADPDRIGSVRIRLAGPVAWERTEEDDGSPLTLFGDSQDGEDLSGRSLPAGRYVVEARPYTGVEGTGAGLTPQSAAFEIASYDPSVPPVAGFTLLDGGASGRELGAVADGGNVDASASATGTVDIRVDVAPERPDVEEVALELRGPRDVTRRDGTRPFSLLGGTEGDDAGSALPNGAYTLTARPYNGSGDALAERRISFTVAGAHEAGATPFSRFALVDPAAGTDLGVLVGGAVVDAAATTTGALDFRAELGARRGDVRSAVLELRGPRDVTRRVDRAPWLLFGGDGSALANGTYTLTVRPHTARVGGDALPETTVTFSVVGGHLAGVPPVAGFTLVDVGGDTLGPVVDGATLDLSASATGAVDVRAEPAGRRADVARVRLELRGPRNATRTVDGRSGWSLFEAVGGTALPNGTYRLTARAFDSGGGSLGTATVAFEVTGSHDSAAPPVAGFTLVDAADGPPDPDLGPIVDGATVDLAASGGWASIRADLAPRRADVKSVELELSGPSGTTRVGTTAPFALFEVEAGDYTAGVFLNGEYTLTARPFTGHGDALPASSVSFTVTGGVANPVSGFVLVDAVRDEDVRSLVDGERIDASELGDGLFTIRVEVSPGLAVDGVALDVATPWRTDTWEQAAGPFAVHRPWSPGNYRGAALVDGVYRLTGRALKDGLQFDLVTVSFTVAGGLDPKGGPLTGFTLVHAEGGLPDRDAATIVDGGRIDLAALAMGANRFTVRADAWREVGSVELWLSGPLTASRTENEAPYALHADVAGDLEGVVWSDGAYTVSAVAYRDRNRGGDRLGEVEASFVVTGSYDLAADPLAGIALVEAATLHEVARLQDGVEFLVDADVPLTLRAHGRSPTRAVRLHLEGPVRDARTDTQAPFTLHADGTGMPLLSGRYRATVTAFLDAAGAHAFAQREVEFSVRVGALPAGRDLRALAAAGNGQSYGLWGTDGILWVSDHADGKVYAYDAAADVRLASREISTRAAGNGAPLGLWSDGETLWVADADDRKLYAYRLADGARLGDRDVDLGGIAGMDVWGDGETLWVLEAGGAALRAFGVDGAREAGRDVPLRRAGWWPTGLWSDGARVFAADGTRPAVHVFRDGVESPAERVELPRRNGRPQGLWSDGRTLWVGDANSGRLHSYVLEPPSWNASLTLLRLAGVEMEALSPDRSAYWGTAPASLERTTVTAHAAAGARLVVEPPDADAGTPGHQVALAPGVNEVGIVVTAADGTVRRHRVEVDRRAAAAADTTLAELALTDVDFGPFAAETLAYTASVAHDVAETSVAAQPSDPFATVSVEPADADANAPGHQAALGVGTTEIAVTVTSEGGGASRTYAVAVERASAPVVTLAAAAEAVAEGAPVRFGAELSAPLARELRVPVSVSSEGAFLADAAPASVTFAAGATSASLELATEDDRVAEGDGSVTAALAPGAGYVVGDPGSATVAVRDGDVAAWRVAVQPAEIEEGEAATLEAWIANGVVHATAQPVALAVSGDVSASDYALEPAAPALAAGATAVRVRILARDDGAAEGRETLRLAVSVGGVPAGSASVSVVDRGGLAPAVDGVVQVGRTLRATGAASGGVAAASVRGLGAAGDGFQWLRDGVPVPGATAAHHLLTAADAWSRMTVRTRRGGSWRESAATIPVWPPPGSPPLGDDEEEVLSSLLTVGSTDVYPYPLAGFGVLSRARFGSATATRFQLDGQARELTLAMVSYVGEFSLAATPGLANADGLVVHWDGHRIGPLSARRSAEGTLWTARTPQAWEEYQRYVDGSSDGVRVALSVRRALPPRAATVAALSATVEEGADAEFEVSLDRAAAAPLAVSLDVSADAGALAGEAPGTVTVPAGETSATVALPTADDRVVEGAATVTVTVLAGDGYAVGDPASATVEVADDDAATFAVTATPAEIAEGGEARIAVAVEDGVTFAEDRTLALSVTGTVSASDYALEPPSLALPAGEASSSATFAALADGSEEGPERARIAALLDGAEAGSASVTVRDASTEARLASLELDGVDIGPFDPERTAYSAAVPHGVSSTTTTAEPADARASVEIADAAGSTLGTVRTTALAEGVSEIAATVTAEDGATARTYTATVTRRAVSWGTRLPGRDIALEGEGEASAVWSDGSTVWAADFNGETAHAHSLANGSPLASRDIALSGYQHGALYGRGGTLWASSYLGGAKAYSLADGTRAGSADLDAMLAAAGNDSPAGMWSDGSALYVSDHVDGHVYAYRLSDGVRLEDREIDLREGDVSAGWMQGLWSDGRTLLTSYKGRGRVLAYRLSDGARLPGLDIATGLAGNGHPQDLWSDGEVLWVVDAVERRLYAYAVPGLLRTTGSGLLPVRVASRASSVPSSMPGRAVSIPDPGLRSRIATALGKPPSAPVGANELLALESLDARGAGIESLAGLERATHLEALDLGGNPLADLRALASLPRLRTLNLDGTGATPWDVAPLARLARLSLRDNGIERLTGLAGLARLRALDLAGNAVVDVAPLAALARLETVDLRGNPVGDVAPLTGVLTSVQVHADAVTTHPAAGATEAPR